MKAIELKETSEDKATPFFWSTTLKTPCTVTPHEATVTVRKFHCGCKSMHENSVWANQRELEHCGNHKGLPNPCAIKAVEYYV